LTKSWLRCEESISPPVYLNEKTHSFYRYEYVSKGSYTQFPVNSLILNFKMSIEEKGKERWHYKKEAIDLFATAIIKNVRLPIQDTIFLPMPTSKPRKHPEFDSRLDEVVDIITKQTGQLVGYNLDLINEEIPYHISGENRDPDQIYININFNPFQDLNPKRVILIDDVITTGAHFVACIRKINSIYPDTSVVGFFLAKTIWQS